MIALRHIRTRNVITTDALHSTPFLYKVFYSTDNRVVSLSQMDISRIIGGFSAFIIGKSTQSL